VKATAAVRLHISRTGVVRDRDKTGTLPEGPPLGWVLKHDGKYQASTPGGVVVGTSPYQWNAINMLFDFLKKGQ
jgi:hypothetical protein